MTSFLHDVMKPCRSAIRVMGCLLGDGMVISTPLMVVLVVCVLTALDDSSIPYIKAGMGYLLHKEQVVRIA